MKSNQTIISSFRTLLSSVAIFILSFSYSPDVASQNLIDQRFIGVYSDVKVSGDGQVIAYRNDMDSYVRFLQYSEDGFSLELPALFIGQVTSTFDLSEDGRRIGINKSGFQIHEFSETGWKSITSIFPGTGVISADGTHFALLNNIDGEFRYEVYMETMEGWVKKGDDVFRAPDLQLHIPEMIISGDGLTVVMNAEWPNQWIFKRWDETQGWVVITDRFANPDAKIFADDVTLSEDGTVVALQQGGRVYFGRITVTQQDQEVVVRVENFSALNAIANIRLSRDGSRLVGLMMDDQENTFARVAEYRENRWFGINNPIYDPNLDYIGWKSDLAHIWYSSDGSQIFLFSKNRNGMIRVYEIDLDPPVYEDLHFNPDSSFIDVRFSEPVYQRAAGSDHDLNPLEASSFRLVLNGQPIEDSAMTIRSLTIGGSSDVIEDGVEELRMHLRSMASLSGDLRIGVRAGLELIDQSGNVIPADSLSPPITLTGYKGLGARLSVPSVFSTIQAAVSIAGDRDSVIIAEGQYEEAIQFNRHDILLASEFAIDGDTEHIHHTVLTRGDNVAILKVVYGNAPSIQGLTIREALADGIYSYDSFPSVEFCYIQDNSDSGLQFWRSDGDYAVSSEVIPTVRNSIISGNRTGLYTQLDLNMSDLIIVENRFSSDPAECCYEMDGNGVYVRSADVVIENSLIAYNTAWREGGGLNTYDSYSEVYNSVIWGNATQSGKADQIRSRDGYDHIDHSIVQNYGENRNLVIRPGDNIYVDDPGIDFEYVLANLSTLLHSGKVDSVLSDSSLVKGNGRPTSLTHDIFGNPRPSPTDSRPDIGPFESADDRVINPVAPTTLIHPSTGAMDVDRRTSFSWGEVRYATTYRFEISKDPFFIDKDVSMNVRDTSILFETPLDADQTYYWRIKAFNSGVEGDWSPTWSFTTGVQTSVEADGDIPEAYSLEQNYPNPFNPTTMIRFTLPIASDVTLEVFNSTGQRVSVLLDGYIPAGTHSVAFDAEGLSSGVYLYRLISRHGILSGIMNKVK